MSGLAPVGMRSRVLMLGAAAWLCAGAQSIGGQQPIAKTSDATAGNSQGVLMERNRARLHPGDPLTIVGREQGDNDLRSRTPALARSDRVSTIVNADENYQRTLAMYEDRASFHRPLASMAAARAASSVDAVPAQATRHVAPRVESAAGGSAWPWVIGLVAAGALVASFVKKLWRPPESVPPAASTRPAPQRARARA